MLWPSLQFLGGLMLLLGGGEALVRGAGAIARGAGVPPVVVGLTVVAFGTSAPELVVAVTGTATGAGGVAFGNVVGANIINIAFILGMTATVRPLIVHRTIMTREIPMLLLAMSAAMVLSLDQLLDGSANRLARGDGLTLGLLFCVFFCYTVMALRRTERDAFVEEARVIGWKLRMKALSVPVGLYWLFGMGCAFVGLANCRVPGLVKLDVRSPEVPEM